MLLRLSGVLLGMLLLLGCASGIPNAKGISNPGYVVVGTGTGQQPRLQKLEIRVRATAGSTSFFWPVRARFVLCPPNRGCPELDFHDPDSMGTVTVRAFPPGKYEIYEVNVFSLDSFGPRIHTSKYPVVVPFTVVENHTAYLGRYLIESLSTMELYDKPVVESVAVMFENREQDLEIARRKLQHLPSVTDHYFPSPNEITQLKFMNTLNNRSEKTQVLHSGTTDASTNPCPWGC